MKLLTLLIAFLLGVISGFALAAWVLYDPIPIGPAKYTFMPSPDPVPPYTLDGSKKLFEIICISESDKDCLQETPIIPSFEAHRPSTRPPIELTPLFHHRIPEPGTLLLMGIGLLGLGWRRMKA